MRTVISVGELDTFRQCPERERRRKLDTPGTQIERDYRSRMRTLLVRYYAEMLEGNLLTEAQVRRLWSTLWEVSIQTTRQFEKHNASFLNAMMSPEEKMLLRGATVINKITSRRLNGQIRPVVVDEAFSLERGSFTLAGTYDLVFVDRAGTYVIVDWTEWMVKDEKPFELRYAVMLEAFKQTFAHDATILTDYILTLGDYLVPSPRSVGETSRQVDEAFQIARALSLETSYRIVGDHCRQCPYRGPCIGGKLELVKRPPGRPRKQLTPAHTAE